MIQVANLSKRFGDKLVIDHLTLTLEEGKTTCILGPSGCGKTTLLHLIAGLLPADAGEITGLQGKRLSFVFQENRLLPWLNAVQNLTVIGVPRQEAARWLERVGLGGEDETFPDALSGGMRRRLAIARALSYGGDCFFLDEPLQGLDPETAGSIIALIQEVCAQKTVIMITHQMEEARTLAHQILRTQGPPLTLL